MKHRGLVLVIALLVLPLAAAGPVAPAGATTEAALVGVRSLATGSEHTCALLASGQVRCWGGNTNGQLGNGTTSSSDLPVTVLETTGSAPLTGVTQISAGNNLTCARLASGEARCWGLGTNGQLGEGAVLSRNRPAVVANPGGTGPLTNVAQVVAGHTHACARLVSGQVRCWGANNSGQLGDNSSTQRTRPVPVAGVGGTGRLTGATQIDTATLSTCARLATAQARCWGAGNFGQLGNGTTSGSNDPVVVVNANDTGPLTSVAEVGTGDAHGCARLTTGRVRCWGLNGNGQLGDGSSSSTTRPVAVQNPAGDGDLVGVAQLSGGGLGMCARLVNRQVRCWGAGLSDQIGDGDGVHRRLPTPVRNLVDTAPLANVTTLSTGITHSCARLTNGQVRCWGGNLLGQAGGPSDPTHPLPVVVLIA